jgi:hypothetical protein
MSTKYVVNSGGISKSVDKGKAFYQEIVKELGPKPRVLFCFFASARERWEGKFSRYTVGFSEKIGDDVAPVFDLAFPHTFARQLTAADVIYLHGGDDHLLLYWLKKFDLPALWEGKVVATNSASSDALATSFWAVDWRECMDGLGILPIKFISHFRGWEDPHDPRGAIEWTEAKEELANHGNRELPIYALPEGEFAVFFTP